MDNKEVIFTTVSIDINSWKKDYINKGKKLINSVLKYSNFKIIVLTNRPEDFNEFKDNKRVIIEKVTEKELIYPINTGNFNNYIKGDAIELATKYDSDYVVFLDGDTYLTKIWNDKTSLELYNSYNSDVYMSKMFSIEYLQKREGAKWKNIFENLWDDKYLNLQIPQETHIVFKNNQKLKKFCEKFKLLEENHYKHQNVNTLGIGTPITISINMAEMEITYYSEDKWSRYFHGFMLDHNEKIGEIIGGFGHCKECE
jgi:hypothetical protein